jgi:Tfp pilus assembly protein PilF
VIRLLAAVLFLSTGCTLADDSGGNLDAAAQAFQRGEVSVAERLLNVLLAAHPNDAAAYGLLGSVLDAEKLYPQAGAAYRRAMQLSPASATLLNSYARHQLAVGDKAGARATYLRAIELEPGNAAANLQLARMALDERTGAEALKYLAKLSEADRNTEQVQTLLLRAHALEKRPKDTERP